jgi:hypothetical protein
MKIWGVICIIIALASLVTGIVSRVTLNPVGKMALESRAFAGFSALMLLLAISLILLEKK